MSLEQHLADVVGAAVRQALRDHHQVARRGLSVVEAAVSIGKSKQFVYDLIEAGELHARKGGPNGHLIVPVASLDAWLMDGAQTG
jgi:excisionase family DNA binding protein